MDLIRVATHEDLPALYRVCLLTGESGSDGTALFRDPDLPGHAYVGPYLAGQPDLALIVVDPQGVAGYCLATPDTRAFEAWAEAAWWPALREQYPMPDDASAERSAGGSADAEIIRLFHAPRERRTRSSMSIQPTFTSTAGEGARTRPWADSGRDAARGASSPGRAWGTP